MNHGIGNVKGKGGGHPTITLSASQFSDTTNLTFTQAQAEILQNNEVVNVVLPDNTNSTFYKITNDYMSSGAILFSQSIQNPLTDNGGKMENVLVLCNPSTYVGTVIQLELKGTIANPTLSGNETELTSIGIGSVAYKIGGGKQLYQHNIKLFRSGFDYVCFFKIINDESTPYNDRINDLFTYLSQFTFTTNTNMLDSTYNYNVIEATGRDQSSGVVIVGVGYDSSINKPSMLGFNVSSNSWTSRQLDTLPSVKDKVIAL